MEQEDIKIFTKPAYFRELVERIKRTRRGDRIALASMNFDPKVPEVQAIAYEIGQAAQRGANASIAIDAIEFIGNAHGLPGPLFFHAHLPSKLRQPYRTIYEAMEHLRGQGVRYAITNQPSRLFASQITGRSHIKFAVINDLAFIGGCNLNFTENLDAMVAIHNKKLSDWLYEFSNNMLDAMGTSFMHGIDQTYSINANNTLLIDAGARGQSIILERALDLIDRATQYIYITTQFILHGETMRHLVRAHRRGVKIIVVYKHSSKHTFPNNLMLYGLQVYERLKRPTVYLPHDLYHEQSFLHAKLLITDVGIMVGSHNYSPIGVAVGTAEMALISLDTKLKDDLTHLVNTWLSRKI
jgi:phosphatidylserine/phosphatidylglycerophosphate/cardiolipin synthase-like enzyme